MPLITCYAELNFHFSDVRSLFPRRDTYMYIEGVDFQHYAQHYCQSHYFVGFFIMIDIDLIDSKTLIQT